MIFRGEVLPVLAGYLFVLSLLRQGSGVWLVRGRSLPAPWDALHSALATVEAGGSCC